MEKIEKLTLEQESQIVPHRDFWLNYILSCKNSTDRDQAAQGIEWLYKLIGKKRPMMFFVDSPYACQLAANILKVFFKNQVGAQVRAQVGDQVGDQVWDQVWDQVGDQVWAQVGDQVWAQVRAQVWDQVWAQVRAQVGDQVGDQVWAQVGDQVWAQVRAQVWDQVRAQVRAQVGAQVGDQVGAQVGDQVWAQVRDQVWAQVGDQVRAQVWDQGIEYYSMSSYGNTGDYGWVAWMDYFLQLDIVKSDRKDDFNAFKRLLLSGVFDMIQLEGLCIVSDMPTAILRDSDNRLHSLETEAILFRDGYGQHYIHGRHIPSDLFREIKDKSLTPDRFFSVENEEVKSACISMMQELYGEEYVFTFFREKLAEVNTYVDKKDERYLVGTTGGMNIGVYTLFKGSINGEDVAYVRCYCPSTDRMFFLGVSPEHNNAKDAIASLYRVPKKLKEHIKEINRQGERYSTVFTNKGKLILKKLSKEDIQNTVTITGNKYFNYIKYEY